MLLLQVTITNNNFFKIDFDKITIYSRITKKLFLIETPKTIFLVKFYTKNIFWF
jgi:hypothetical protein